MSYISRQTTFATIDDYEAYAARLTEMPRYFGQHKANMRRGIQTNMTASAEIMPGIISAEAVIFVCMPRRILALCCPK